MVLKTLIEKAGIGPPYPRTMLNIYSPENGQSIMAVQELLGHNSPNTTMIYTPVSKTSLDKIKNPLDDFDVSNKERHYSSVLFLYWGYIDVFYIYINKLA